MTLESILFVIELLTFGTDYFQKVSLQCTNIKLINWESFRNRESKWHVYISVIVS